MRVRIASVPLLLFLFSVAVSSAQISGRITDAHGNAVSGATVRFVDPSQQTFTAITDTDGSYTVNTPTGIGGSEGAGPAGFSLGQNSPNPFNPTTAIRFSLDRAGFAKLSIYNALGQKIRTLVQGTLAAGAHTAAWNGRDDRGLSAAAGLYLYILESGKNRAVRKMLLLDGGGSGLPGGVFRSASPAPVVSRTLKAAENPVYRVSITGDGIAPFSKTLAPVNYHAPLDFMVAGAGDGFFLSVLHTGDVHSRFLPFTIWGVTGEFGGAARRAATINMVRNRTQNALLVDSGDEVQGTLFYTVFKGAAEKKILPLLGYDAMVPGNHELDDGPSMLAGIIDAMDFPFVAANMDAGGEPLLKGKFQPFIIREFNGRKVGIIGYLTEDTAILSRVGGLKFTDIRTSVAASVRELQNQGVNIIVALSHTGYREDKQIAAALSGIDIIVSGHSHTLLSSTLAGASGPYPDVVSSPDGEPVLIVAAGEWGRFLGDINVLFNDRGVASSWNGGPVPVDGSVGEDSAVSGETARMNADLSMYTAQVVGRSDTEIESPWPGIRTQETTMGNLVADAIRWEGRDQGVQMAFQNGGSVRAGIKAGDITLGQVMEVLPFGNTWAVCGMSGANIRRSIEYGVSNVENTKGQFLHVSGLKYSYNPANPSGSRIVDVKVVQSDGSLAELEDATVYKVATDNYVRQGGDGHAIFAAEAVNPYDYGRVVADVVADYITQHSPVAPKLEGRITVVK